MTVIPATNLHRTMLRVLLVIALLGFAAGMAMLVAYNLSDRYVAADGTLVEPFYLVPLGALALGISALAGVGAAIIAVAKRARQRTAPNNRSIR